MGIMGLAGLGKKQNPISKMARAERTRAVTQVVLPKYICIYLFVYVCVCKTNLKRKTERADQTPTL
jgi:hypothetical protein